MTSTALQRRIRVLLWIFIAGLVVSGGTAIPLETEVNLLAQIIGANDSANLEQPGLLRWLALVRDGIVATNAKYPFKRQKSSRLKRPSSGVARTVGKSATSFSKMRWAARRGVDFGARGDSC